MAKVFNIRDKVFDPLIGWGEVTDYFYTSDKPVLVWYDSKKVSISYTENGKRDESHLKPLLSLREYDFVNGGYSLTKDYNYTEYIGKYGKFKDNNSEDIVINKLKEYHSSDPKPFTSESNTKYDTFTPLNYEEIIALNLTA